MDLIKREDAIKAVADYLFNFSKTYGFRFDDVRKSAGSILNEDEISSVEPRCIATIQLSQEQLDEAFEKVKSDILSLKPKTGKWFIVEQDRYMVYSVRCSECNYNISWLANYCPNCGCKMEVE